METTRPLQAIGRALRRPVRADHSNLLAFGWVILFLFLIQVVTGSLLSLYYQPSPDVGAESVEFIMRDVSWGWLIRGSHNWASVGMIVLGAAQAVRVFATGVYRERPGNWYVGWILMLLVVWFAFSGELLTYDQESHRMLTLALDELARIPIVGASLALALRGGKEVGAATLSRIYSVHVMLLPWLTSLLVLFNIWLLAQGPTRRKAR